MLPPGLGHWGSDTDLDGGFRMRRPSELLAVDQHGLAEALLLTGFTLPNQHHRFVEAPDPAAEP
jgi:hypothetical protein